MSDKEFLENIKVGQYVKIQRRSDKPYVQKVFKVTRTQIVIHGWNWSDSPNVDRFRISDGYLIADSYYRYDRPRIISETVSPEEEAAYEARASEVECMRKERRRIKDIEERAKATLLALFAGHIPAESIKVQFNSNDGMQTGLFEIKCEKVSEQALLCALAMERPA